MRHAWIEDAKGVQGCRKHVRGCLTLKVVAIENLQESHHLRFPMEDVLEGWYSLGCENLEITID